VASAPWSSLKQEVIEEGRSAGEKLAADIFARIVMQPEEWIAKHSKPHDAPVQQLDASVVKQNLTVFQVKIIVWHERTPLPEGGSAVASLSHRRPRIVAGDNSERVTLVLVPQSLWLSSLTPASQFR
jgi:hypothetical protein